MIRTQIVCCLITAPRFEGCRDGVVLRRQRQQDNPDRRQHHHNIAIRLRVSAPRSDSALRRSVSSQCQIHIAPPEESQFFLFQRNDLRTTMRAFPFQKDDFCPPRSSLNVVARVSSQASPRARPCRRGAPKRKELFRPVCLVIKDVSALPPCKNSIPTNVQLTRAQTPV